MNIPEKLRKFAPFVNNGSVCIPWWIDHSWMLFPWGSWSENEADAFRTDLLTIGISRINYFCGDVEGEGSLYLDEDFTAKFICLTCNFSPSEYFLFLDNLDIIIFCSEPCDAIAIGSRSCNFASLRSILLSGADLPHFNNHQPSGVSGGTKNHYRY